MNQQEIFDKVVTHLRKQGAKSLLSRPEWAVESCAYRGQNGMKCAAGCLIEDDEYQEWMEGLRIVGVLHNKINKCPPSLFERIGSSPIATLVSILQNIHDGVHVQSWEESFKFLAERFDLTYSPP